MGVRAGSGEAEGAFETMGISGRASVEKDLWVRLHVTVMCSKQSLVKQPSDQATNQAVSQSVNASSNSSTKQRMHV